MRCIFLNHVLKSCAKISQVLLRLPFITSNSHYNWFSNIKLFTCVYSKTKIYSKYNFLLTLVSLQAVTSSSNAEQKSISTAAKNNWAIISITSEAPQSSVVWSTLYKMPGKIQQDNLEKINDKKPMATLKQHRFSNVTKFIHKNCQNCRSFLQKTKVIDTCLHK